MWELNYKVGWTPKNWCFRTVVLEKTLESHLDCKEIKPVNPKGNQSWIFIGRTDVEAEAPILWSPDAKSRLTGKDPDAGRLKAGEEDYRGWDGWTASLTQCTWVWANSRDSEGQQAWHPAVHGVTKNWTRLSDWTTMNSEESSATTDQNAAPKEWRSERWTWGRSVIPEHGSGMRRMGHKSSQLQRRTRLNS